MQEESRVHDVLHCVASRQSTLQSASPSQSALHLPPWQLEMLHSALFRQLVPQSAEP